MRELDEYPNTAYILEKYESYIIHCLEREHSKLIIKELTNLLEPIYEIRHNDGLIWVYKEDELLCIIDNFDPAIIITCFEIDTFGFIYEAYWGDIRVENIACISSEHIIEHYGDLSFEISTGFLDQELKIVNFEDLLPISIFRLFLNQEEIGKAVVSYCNYEMGDLNPTIKYIEIISTHRRLSYGSQFLKFIEEYLERFDFDLVWASNVQEYLFFKKNGYLFDLDEGYKYLG